MYVPTHKRTCAGCRGVAKGWRDRAVSDLIILLGRRSATRCMWHMVAIEKNLKSDKKYMQLEGTRFLVTLTRHIRSTTLNYTWAPQNLLH